MPPGRMSARCGLMPGNLFAFFQTHAAHAHEHFLQVGARHRKRRNFSAAPANDAGGRGCGSADEGEPLDGRKIDDRCERLTRDRACALDRRQVDDAVAPREFRNGLGKTNGTDLARNQTFRRRSRADRVFRAAAARIDDADAFAVQRAEGRDRTTISARSLFVAAEHAQRHAENVLHAGREFVAVRRSAHGARRDGEEPHVVAANRCAAAGGSRRTCAASVRRRARRFDPVPRRCACRWNARDRRAELRARRPLTGRASSWFRWR